MVWNILNCKLVFLYYNMILSALRFNSQTYALNRAIFLVPITFLISCAHSVNVVKYLMSGCPCYWLLQTSLRAGTQEYKQHNFISLSFRPNFAHIFRNFLKFPVSCSQALFCTKSCDLAEFFALNLNRC